MTRTRLLVQRLGSSARIIHFQAGSSRTSTEFLSQYNLRRALACFASEKEYSPPNLFVARFSTESIPGNDEDYDEKQSKPASLLYKLRNVYRISQDKAALGFSGLMLAASPLESIASVHETTSNSASISSAAASDGAAAVTEAVIATAGTAEPTMSWYFPLVTLLEQVHAITGLEWWATIALTATSLRLCMFPLTIYTQKSNERMQAAAPYLQEIRDEVNSSSKDIAHVLKYRSEYQRILKEHKASPYRPLLGPLIQGPIFLALFFSIRDVAANNPELKTGGMLWFTDLSVPDPTYVLPVLVGVSMLAMLELAQSQAPPNVTPLPMMKYVFRFMGIATIPVSSYLESALMCNWIPNNVIGVIQTLVLKNDKARVLFGLKPRSFFQEVQKKMQDVQKENYTQRAKSIMQPRPGSVKVKLGK